MTARACSSRRRRGHGAGAPAAMRSKLLAARCRRALRRADGDRRRATQRCVAPHPRRRRPGHAQWPRPRTSCPRANTGSRLHLEAARMSAARRRRQSRALRERRARVSCPPGSPTCRGASASATSVACLTPRATRSRAACLYDAREIDASSAEKTSEIPEVLGYSNGDEVIHRDNLIVFWGRALGRSVAVACLLAACAVPPVRSFQ